MFVIPAAGPAANQVPDTLPSPGVVRSGPQADSPINATRTAVEEKLASRKRTVRVKIIQAVGSE